MKIAQEDIDGGIVKVTLVGSLDVEGSGVVDMPFSVISGTNDKVIVDFTDVDFLASIGIRVLVKAAKAVGNRGGRLAVYNPNEAARSVMASTGVDTIIFVTDDEAAAIAAVS
ncbi:STAS domain-containing protein [Oricola sp.]|uniref:STAS domain-containing protein n=1 Tax=Oricola sp. TaxID=1979950 RepID=UPI0025EB0EFF|nr:STAS domain-containing protein [Oricola sp.]MCI5077058.1 STAS domain-containing protein [Oricola sp.]